MEHGPLHGVRITEFTSAWAGPYATCLLGFLGAEVIKVESRRRLDHSRVLAFSTGKVFTNPNQSSVFNSLNLNKRSITLNLTKPKAVEMAKKVIGISDAVIENMRPGVMPRLGLGYEAVCEVKPDIIYLSSSACGQTGPEREYVGYAPTFAALGGISFLTGYPDWPPSQFMGAIDLRSATTATFCILTALIHRQRTGEGQYIDMASQETIAALIGDQLIDYVMNQRVPMRKGNEHDILAPHNCYRCIGEDRWISIAVASAQEWKALCEVMGKPGLAEDPKFADMYNRYENRKELDDILGEWTRDKDAFQLTETLQKAGVAAFPSMSSKDLFEDKHLRSRGVYAQVNHPFMGNDWVITPPWRLSETPALVRRHSPVLAEDNDHVFAELLGISQEEIKQLEDEQVVY